MSVGVEEDSDVFLRLHRGEGGAAIDSPLYGDVKVIDGDVEMLGGILSAGNARPGRPDELLFVLEVQDRPGLGRWRADLGPSAAVGSPATGGSSAVTVKPSNAA